MATFTARSQLCGSLYARFVYLVLYLQDDPGFSALDEILYVSAGLAIFGGIGALLSIRSKDFVAPSAPHPPAAQSVPAAGAG